MSSDAVGDSGREKVLAYEEKHGGDDKADSGELSLRQRAGRVLKEDLNIIIKN